MVCVGVCWGVGGVSKFQEALFGKVPLERRPEGVGRGSMFQQESILVQGSYGQSPAAGTWNMQKASVTRAEWSRKGRVGNEVRDTG